MKVFHYREKCIGCNACVESAPDYWEIDSKDGKANLKHAKISKGIACRDVDKLSQEANVNAARDCPVNIIKIQK
jgi:ferredoxin